MIAVCDFTGADNIESYFQKMFESEIKVVTSGMIWIDFIAPNANKGTALAGVDIVLNRGEEKAEVIILPSACGGKMYSFFFQPLFQSSLHNPLFHSFLFYIIIFT